MLFPASLARLTSDGGGPLVFVARQAQGAPGCRGGGESGGYGHNCARLAGRWRAFAMLAVRGAVEAVEGNGTNSNVARRLAS